MDHVAGLVLLASVSVPASSMTEQVEEVDTAERSVGLSGVDLVDGTPVLDIKPYVPDYDCPRAADSGFPDDRGDRGYVRVAVSTAEWYCSMGGMFFAIGVVRANLCRARVPVRGCSGRWFGVAFASEKYRR